MKKIFIAICAAAALASCSTGQKAVSLADLDGEWNIVKINGNGVVAPDGQDAPFIGFKTSDKLVYGSTSCNRLTGALTADPATGTIDFGTLGSTRMMCPDMAVEDLLLGTLGDVKTFSVKKGGTLLLNNADGRTVVELKKK